VIDQTSNVGENTKRILDKKVKMLKILVKKSEQKPKNTKNKAQSATEDDRNKAGSGKCQG